MRPLLCLLLAGCAVPTEPRVVQRSALQTMAPLTVEQVRPRRAVWLPCAMRPDTVTLWVGRTKYLEILYQCF
jgi:hypothetical protein